MTKQAFYHVRTHAGWRSDPAWTVAAVEASGALVLRRLAETGLTGPLAAFAAGEWLELDWAVAPAPPARRERR